MHSPASQPNPGIRGELAPMPEEQPVLQTERLTLRRFRLTDVDDVVAFANDEEWQHFLPLPYPYERIHGEQFVAKSFLRDWKSRPAFAIVLDDTVIGEINLTIDKKQQSAEMGYGIARKHWGNGYATEAVRAVVGWVFETFLPSEDMCLCERRQQPFMARDGTCRHDEGGPPEKGGSRR